MNLTGRVYKPEDLADAEERRKKGKYILVDDHIKRVTEAKTIESINRSDYSVVEQLKRLPPQISIPFLLLSSEAHRYALFNILNESHIPEGIATKNFEHIIGQIIRTNTSSFSEYEPMPEGT